MLLPRLIGSVFHVTPARAFLDILSDGLIKANRDGNLGFNYSENSYGRLRGYICLIDLRNATDEELNQAQDKWNYLDPWGWDRRNPVFLLVDEAEHEKLITWRAAQGSGEMYIPWVESWYAGELTLNKIKSALALTIEREPEHPHIKAIRERNSQSGRDAMRGGGDGPERPGER